MYDKVSPNLNFVEREKKTEKFWEDNHIFQKSIDERKEGDVYTFYDGPPTANGKPHIGHVLTRVIKDMIPRYRTRGSVEEAKSLERNVPLEIYAYDIENEYVELTNENARIAVSAECWIKAGGAVRTYTADFFDISYLITHYYEILIVWIFVEYIFIVIDTCLNKILKHT